MMWMSRRTLVVALLMILIGVFSAEAQPQTDPPPYELVDVIGQINLGQTAFNTVGARRGMHLGGVHVHSYGSGSKAFYVYDSGNSRILAFRDPDFQLGLDLPDLIFGQDDFGVTSACNGDNNSITVPPTARTLCLNRGAHAVSQEEEPRRSSMATDTNGNFYVIDQYNNRLLMFRDPFGADPGEGDTTADQVWGQPDFTSKVCNRGTGIPGAGGVLSSSSLCTTNTVSNSIDVFFITSLVMDSWQNLWVTDIINNRVLRFPHDPVTGLPRLTADIVLGQSSMTSYGFASFYGCNLLPAGQGFCQLISLQINPATGQLFVVQYYEGPRITVYTPNTNTQSPTAFSFLRTIGQGTLLYPGSIVFLDATRFIIEDELSSFNDVLRVFSATTGLLLKTMTSSHVVGSSPDGAINFREIQGEMSLVGNTLYMTEQGQHNSLLAFDITQLDTLNQIVYTGEMLGGENYVLNTVTGLGLTSPFGITISQKHRQIFVSDGYRVLVWNMNGVSYTGRPADYVIGQPTLFTNRPTTSGSFVFRAKVGGLAVDDVNDKVWVSRDEEFFAFNLPISANSPLPNRSFLSRIPHIPSIVGNLPVRGESQNLAFSVGALMFNPVDQTLWLIDTNKSRAAQVINPYTIPLVNLIVGQNTIDGVGCNRGVYSAPSAKTLCFPASGAFDRHGNLYIAEGVFEGRADMPGNKRIVEYDKATIDAAAQVGLLAEPAADRVYSVPNFTTSPLNEAPSSFQCLENLPCNPIALALDPWGRMVVMSDAYYNEQYKRIYLYRNPLLNAGYVQHNFALGDLRLPYAVGQGGFAIFSWSGKLFTQDHTWNRVLVSNINMPNTVSVSTRAIAVEEGNQIATYTLRLDVQPISNVTILPANNGQTLISPTEVIFTPETWNTAQTITVTAIDDTKYEDIHTDLITHSISSNDRTYDNIRVDSVDVTITDNDDLLSALGEVVNGTFEFGEPSPVGWTATTPGTSGVVCRRTAGLSGSCALKLLGARSSPIFSQSLANVPEVGQIATLSVWAKWNLIRQGGGVRLQLTYADGTKGMAVVNFPTKPASRAVYQNWVASVTVTQQVVSAKVMAYYANISGVLWLDDVSVNYSTSSVRQNPDGGEPLTLPPAPPDGFRGNN